MEQSFKFIHFLNKKSKLRLQLFAMINYNFSTKTHSFIDIVIRLPIFMHA